MFSNELLCFSYEEHLKTMVLREEFFPFMEEVKSSVAAMIKGANGSPSHIFYPPPLGF